MCLITELQTDFKSTSNRLRDRVLYEARSLGFHVPKRTPRVIRKDESANNGTFLAPDLIFLYVDRIVRLKADPFQVVAHEIGHWFDHLAGTIKGSSHSRAETVAVSFQFAVAGVPERIYELRRQSRLNRIYADVLRQFETVGRDGVVDWLRWVLE